MDTIEPSIELDGASPEQLAEYMAKIPDAELLPALSALEPDGQWRLYLDSEAAMVWLVYVDDPEEEDPLWTVELVGADYAVAIMLEEPLCHDFLGLVDPAIRTDRWRIEALKELNTVSLAARRHQARYATLPDDASPGWGVDMMINAQIKAARAEVARLEGLRAHHIADHYGTTLDDVLRASPELGMSPLEILGLLKDHADLWKNPGQHPIE